jgi:phosphatidylinositol alpha-1,6-mannosyltransferase
MPRGTVHVASSAVPEAEAFDRTHDLPITRIALRFPNWGVFNRHSAWCYLSTLRSLRRLVKRTRPAVVHCGKCLPEGFLARTLRAWGGPPYWCYAHGEELTLARTSSELTWLTRRALRGAAGVVANSRHTRDLLARDWGVSPERVHVLHPGVDTHTFVPAPPDPAVRADLGWGERPVVLTVGALQQRKGQDMMIRALPKLLRRFPDLLYVIAGEGWERTYLERLVNDLGVGAAVQFRGVPQDDELVRCYQQCDLFALPNRQVGWNFEGFGIVLLEAQACGKPVLAGDSGGTAETLRASETGVVADCTSPDALAGAVADCLSDPGRLARMGARARPWAVEQFDWSALLPRAAKLFEGALTTDPARARRPGKTGPVGIL